MGDGRGNGVLGGGVSEVSEEGGVSLLGFLKESGGPWGEGLVGAAIVEDVRGNEMVE